ncbi:hypothetical protein [Rossellomorea marisflavi]|uniref:hypothetical protein n=1 Tax=Rossellomorea marisflavi TaxID=189381 RepID=UPI003F9EF3A6
MENKNTELFKEMPEKVADFLMNRAFTDYLIKRNEEIVCDAYYEKLYSEATFYIEKNKKLFIRIDYIPTPQELASEYFFNSSTISDKEAKQLLDSLEAKHQELLKMTTDSGYQFSLSHPSGLSVCVYWDLIIDLEKWKEDTFVSIWKKVEEVTNVAYELMEKAGYYKNNI